MSVFSIKYWADKLGEELWQLGQSVTRATDMKAVSSLKLRIMHASFCVVTNLNPSNSTQIVFFKKPYTVWRLRPSVV